MSLIADMMDIKILNDVKSNKLFIVGGVCGRQ